MPKPEKVATVEALRELFASARGIYLTDFRGLDVAAMTELRRRLKASGSGYRVVRNTLARLAAEQAGLPKLAEAFQGPTGVAFTLSEDGVAPARVLRDFVKDFPELTIKTAFVEGRAFPPERVSELASLPPREELVAKALGGIRAPLAGLIWTLSGVLYRLVVVLDAIARKEGK
ncbi:MAG: 50S ribosomal protein L10 [Candidatus Latescibacterota bacterium]|nr:MAG: 50S ribosomal protein L10 [Candidatus Latescibacterota bacterium]